MLQRAPEKARTTGKVVFEAAVVNKKQFIFCSASNRRKRLYRGSILFQFTANPDLAVLPLPTLFNKISKFSECCILQ
jgi:hypothetical protein